MVNFTGLLENARHPAGGPSGGGTLRRGDLCKNRLPARIRGWAGTATGGHIHVVHISHTHPPKELIQTQRIYLLGKNPTRPTDLGGTCFYVSAETLSLESPFPKLRNLVPSARAGIRTFFHKLGSENVKTCCTRKLLKKICFAKHEADCQRR